MRVSGVEIDKFYWMNRKIDGKLNDESEFCVICNLNDFGTCKQRVYFTWKSKRNK